MKTQITETHPNLLESPEALLCQEDTGIVLLEDPIMT